MNSIQKKRGAKRGNPFASSVTITALTRVSSWIRGKLENGFFGNIFCAYKRENNALGQSAIVSGARRIDLGGRILSPAKRTIARGIENSFIISGLRERLVRMLGASMKSYGIFTFSFALYSALIYLFKVFYFDSVEIDGGMLVTLVVMLIASVAMISSRHTLASALRSSPAASFFLFNAVGLRRETLEGIKEGTGRFHIAFIAGLVFGIASFFVHPLLLICLTLLLVGAYLVLVKPEFGVLCIFAALPFAPTMALVAAVLYVALCFLMKLMCGKRSVRFDLLDGAVGLFLLLMAGGGVVAASSESIKPALVFCVFMLGYFLAVNLIRSREWIIRCVVGLIGSCTLVALYGLFQNFFGFAQSTWHDTKRFGDIAGRVVSTFENPNVLAEYLIMIIPLIFAMFIITKHPRARFALAIAGICSGGCLIYTWSRGAWLGCVIGMTVFLLMYHRHTLTALLFGALGIPFLPLVLPQSIINRFTSIGDMKDGSTVYRVNIWRGVADMLEDYGLTGVGIGEASFTPIYHLYALSGIETAPHSHNLYLQITVELGIFGLIAFLAMLFIWAQSCFTLHHDEIREDKLLSTAVFAGLLGVLAQGLTDYIWYNYRVFLMFWLILGLGAAVRKTLDSTAQNDIF